MHIVWGGGIETITLRGVLRDNNTEGEAYHLVISEHCPHMSNIVDMEQSGASYCSGGQRAGGTKDKGCV